MANKTIKALVLLHGLKTIDGKKNVEAGDTCECDAKTASWAVDGGFAEYADAKAEAKTKAPTKDPATLESFSAAVATLDKENKAHFTKAGKPDCNALADAGCEVSAAERDAFWEEMNPPA